MGGGVYVAVAIMALGLRDGISRARPSLCDDIVYYLHSHRRQKLRWDGKRSDWEVSSRVEHLEEEVSGVPFPGLRCAG